MKYNVTINGNKFEVEVERVGESRDQVKRASKIVTEAPPAKAEKFRATSSSVTASAGETVKSPMPGTIMSINVSEGQTVEKGDVLFILEAMKMENEIIAHRDAVVAKIAVSSGAPVRTGDPLILLK